MLTVIFMMVSGRMIKLMAMDNIHTLMEHSMREIGLMINNTAWVKNAGPMVLNMKETINTVKKMVMDNFYGQINLRTVAISLIITFMDKEDIDGLMAVNIVVIGNVIRCMDKECSLGPMVVNMMGSTSMIRNKVMVYLHGPMAASIMEHG